LKPASALFRPEVMRHRAERLHGDVSLVTPLGWQVIGFLLFAGLIAAASMVLLGSYARVETVAGAVALDKGVAQVVPSRAGIVAELFVADGASVKAGQPLVRIRSEEAMAAGSTAPARMKSAIDEQDSRLSEQSALLLSAASEEGQRLSAQAAGLSNEVIEINEQIADQKRLVDVAQAEFHDLEKLTERGFVSRRDLAVREATLLSRRQQLAQLQQMRASKESDIIAARRSVAQSLAGARAQAASTAASRAELSQRLTEVEQTRGYVLTAPVDGTVTALTARLGQPAGTDQTLMLVMPANARPRVELQVPTAAVGFISHGQPVRLAIDAFPYQTFGTVEATISDISEAAVARPTQNGVAIVYPVTATMRRSSIVAYGRTQRLMPGMTLTARIVTGRRTLLEWLFDPIFAVRNR